MSHSRLGKILVGGGTGFIGSNLCKLLKRRGYNVCIISRMPGPSSINWNDLQKNGLPDSTVAVVNVAGQNVLDPKQRWNPGFKQNVYNSRVNTNRILAAAINDAGVKPKSFVTISGVGIYKPDDEKEYDEDSIIEPYDFLSRMCVDWEKAGNVDGVCAHSIIRSGVVLAKGGGMIKQLYLPYLLGLGGPVLPGTQFLPWIHMHDLCNLILFAIEQSVCGVLNGVSPVRITNRQFSKAFAKALQRPDIFPVPQFVLNFVLGKERADMLTKGQIVNPKKVLRLGFEYKYSDINEACNHVVNSN